jgi:hypothetical protein
MVLSSCAIFVDVQELVRIQIPTIFWGTYWAMGIDLGDCDPPGSISIDFESLRPPRWIQEVAVGEPQSPPPLWRNPWLENLVRCLSPRSSCKSDGCISVYIY